MTQIEKKVCDLIESRKEELYSLLSKLIQINTENFISYGNETECTRYVEGLYKDLGLETDFYFPDDIPGIKDHPAYLDGRGMDKRPNVTGVYKGTSGQKKVMLAAHTDTMPIGDESLWTVPPLGGLIKDSRIYGRGSGDNKFGIASSYVALKAIMDLGIKLKNDVLLTAYCDEEYGGGDGSLAACLKYPCDTYINLDGGNYEMWICAIGGQVLELKVKSLEPLDSAEKTIDALYLVKEELKPFAQNRRDELDRDKYYHGSDMQRSAFRIHSFGAGDFGTDLDVGTIKFVYYTNRSKAEIDNELDKILQRVRKKLAAMNMSISDYKPLTRYFDYGKAPDDDPAVLIMTDAASEAAGRKVPVVGACLSDLSIYLPHGSKSSFNFGIMRDFKLYGGAHQPDEYVECNQFLNCTKALALFLLRWCGYEQ